MLNFLLRERRIPRITVALALWLCPAPFVMPSAKTVLGGAYTPTGGKRATTEEKGRRLNECNKGGQRGWNAGR
jgi:hypothetical protein